VAKEQLKVEQVGPLLQQLQDVGFRIDDNVLNAALELAGEK
jgi:predicted nucleic acid-binding protein